uniref:Pyridoxal phosphate homeostasis protein n=2 Tax=Lutzomyia longipalpis TaxID=7200 RepID=A0A1B0CUS6_LUTLO
MFRKVMSEVDIKQNLKLVVGKIEEAFRKRSPSLQTEKPYLVAVSKTKPAELVVEAYSAGQRHFGENYVQELVEKSHNPELLEKCKDIKWHFIGHLQSNKVNKVLAVPGLYMIETVDSVNLATAINKAWEKFRKEETENLKVLVQVNTSAEDVKSGIDPKEAINLYKTYEDFIALMQCYDEIVKELQLNPRELHVSMGMSNDYEHAIAAGSTIVRVGTSIFGARTPKSDAK